MAKGGVKKKKAGRAGSAKATAAESPKPVKAIKPPKPPKPPKSPKAPKAPKPPKVKSGSTVAKAVKGAKAAAGKLSDNPLVAEVVASALVATAAALRNPGQARRMASEAADELHGAIDAGERKTSAFWQLALDVARRSIETLESQAGQSGRGKKKKP